MTILDEKLAPAPITGVDFKSLGSQPTPEEFFVLSRVDGAMTVAELCTTTGLGKEKTLQCLSRLKENGLISFPGQHFAGTPAATPKSAHTSDSDASSGENDLGESILSRFPLSPDNFSFDGQLLAQEVELEADFKKEVLFVYAQLDHVDYYQLLGAQPEADRRELRKAYFSMSKRYHPDRFFRKVLGDYEPMVDKIFQRITKAYQTLSNKSKRQEYDRALQAHSARSHAPVQTSTPASQRSETMEAMVSDRKREMAFQVLTRRAEEAFDAGAIAAAVGEFRKALSLKRDLGVALHVARRLLQESDYLDDAIAFARAAQKIDPSSVDALALVGEVYERKGSPADALYHYEKALKLNPGNSDLAERVARLRQN